MIKINNTQVKKVLKDGVRTHQVKLNGQVIFDDTCVVTWAVTYTYGNGTSSLFSVWSASLTVSVSRKDSYSGITTSVKVISSRSDNGDSTENTYTTPLSSQQIGSGSMYWRSLAPFTGYDKFQIIINGTTVNTYQFTLESLREYTNSYNGELEYYES